MGGIALIIILAMSLAFTWVIVISAASLGILLNPILVFIVVALLIVKLSI